MSGAATPSSGILIGIDLDGKLKKKDSLGNVTEVSTSVSGNFTESKTITTNSTNTLTLSGLTTNNTPAKIIVANDSGVIQQATYSTLLTNISNNTIGNLNLSNGLTRSGTNIKLGGSLSETTSVNLGDFPLILQNKLTSSSINSEFTFSKNFAVLDTFDNITSTPNGSRSRVISSKSSTAMWTTKYQYNSNPNPAYNAFAYWLSNVKPWIPAEFGATGATPATYPSGVSFQIVDNLLGSNANSSLQAHYFDERVTKSEWKDTWSSETAPNKYGSTFSGWIPGKTYMIRNYELEDDFSGAFTGTRSGVLNTTGFTFISNGNPPADWTHGSLIDGDFPITDLNDRTAYISTTEVNDPADPFHQKGIVRIQSNATYIDGFVDQGGSSRGLRLAIIGAGDPLPTSAVVGEMFYRLDDASIVFKIDNTNWKKLITDTTS
jgi:hypothetical protein